MSLDRASSVQMRGHKHGPASTRVRNLVLWLALAGSVAAALWTRWQEDAAADLLPASSHVTTKAKGTTVAEPASQHSGDRETATELVSAISNPSMFVASAVDQGLSATARAQATVQVDPFAPLAVALPPPPKPVAPPPVVAPTAPPLPFQYLGKMDASPKSSAAKPGTKEAVAASSGVVVFLGRGNESFSVSAGDSIDANYRFVGIEGDVLVFLYLPLSERQTLQIGP